MKHPIKPDLLPWLTLALGTAGMILMMCLLLTGVDEAGLFIAGHPAGILVWLTAAGLAICLGLMLQTLGGKTKYSRLFPHSIPAAIGTLCAGASVLWHAVDHLGSNEILPGIVGVAAGVSLVYLAYCRATEQRSRFLVWTGVTAYLMVRLMLKYQTWSSEPQLLSYCFPMLASVCMTLALYYRAAFCMNVGSRRGYVFFTQMGAFFCMAALPVEFDPIYVGLAAWAMTDLCVLHPLKSRRTNEGNPPREDRQ